MIKGMILKKKLSFYLNNTSDYNDKIEEAFNEVLSNHTWKNRIDKLFNAYKLNLKIKIC